MPDDPSAPQAPRPGDGESGDRESGRLPPAAARPGPDGDDRGPYRDLIRAAVEIAREDGIDRPWVVALTLIFGSENVTVTPIGIVVAKPSSAGE